MRSPIVWALPVMLVSILAIPFYMGWVRRHHIRAGRAIAIPGAVMGLVIVVFIAAVVLTIRA